MLILMLTDDFDLRAESSDALDLCAAELFDVGSVQKPDKGMNYVDLTVRFATLANLSLDVYLAGR